MLKISEVTSIKPVGYMDWIGAGHGWHYVVYESPNVQDGYIYPDFDNEFDDMLPPCCFRTVTRDRLTPYDFGDIRPSPEAPLSAWPVIYLAPDGTVFSGQRNEVAAAIKHSLHGNPAMWAKAPLSRLNMVEFTRADDLLKSALADAYAFMTTYPKDSAQMWAASRISEKVQSAVAALMPDAARKDLRDSFHIHIENGNAWFVASSALVERLPADDGDIEKTVQVFVDGFSLDYQGIVHGGKSPLRWKPSDDDAEPSASPTPCL